MVFSPTCANPMKLKTQGGPSVALRISLCVQLSPLCCSALRTLADSATLDSPLHLPSSERSLGPPAFYLLGPQLGHSLQAGSWGSHSTRDPSLLMSIVLVASYILSRFLFLRLFFLFQVGKEVLSLLLHLCLEWKSFTCFYGQIQNHTQSQLRSSCADKISFITADFVFLTLPYLCL